MLCCLFYAALTCVRNKTKAPFTWVFLCTHSMSQHSWSLCSSVVPFTWGSVSKMLMPVVCHPYWLLVAMGAFTQVSAVACMEMLIWSGLRNSQGIFICLASPHMKKDTRRGFTLFCSSKLDFLAILFLLHAFSCVMNNKNKPSNIYLFCKSSYEKSNRRNGLIIWETTASIKQGVFLCSNSPWMRKNNH